MTEPYLHPDIQGRIDELQEATGQLPVVTYLANGWTLAHGNDRVRLTCSYIRNSRGKLRYSSTLSVDGEDRPLVNGIEAYVRLLENPDDKHPNRKPGSALPPVYPLDEGEEVPKAVTVMTAFLAEIEAVTAVKIGHCSMAQRERWAAWNWPLNEKDEVPDQQAFVIESSEDDGTRVQMHYQPHPSVPGAFYLSGVSGLDGQGRDLMAETGKAVDKAIEKLFGIKLPPQKAPDRGPVNAIGDTHGTGYGSVEVRKSTVFRI
jgi:hypothetical protein